MLYIGLLLTLIVKHCYCFCCHSFMLTAHHATFGQWAVMWWRPKTALVFPCWLHRGHSDPDVVTLLSIYLFHFASLWCHLLHDFLIAKAHILMICTHILMTCTWIFLLCTPRINCHIVTNACCSHVYSVFGCSRLSDVQVCGAVGQASMIHSRALIHIVFNHLKADWEKLFLFVFSKQDSWQQAKFAPSTITCQ